MTTSNNALNSSKELETHTKTFATPRILPILYDRAKSLNLKLIQPIKYKSKKLILTCSTSIRVNF